MAPGTDSTPSLLDILGHLKMAVAQLRLYPKDSPQVVKVGTAAYQALTFHLEEKPQLSLSGTPRGLLVNGQRLPGRDPQAHTLEMSLLALLRESSIKSITFHKGVSIEELITFLHALTHKFWDVKEGKEINQRLRQERVLSIRVDEVEYVAVGEGDLVITDAARKLEGGSTKVAELLAALDRMTEEAVDSSVGSEGRIQIMKKLLEQDPTLLQKVRPGSAAPSGGAGGVLPLERARRAIGEIARLLREAPAAMREPLRHVGEMLVECFRDDPGLAAIMKKFLTDEAAELLPVWMQEAAQAGAAEPPSVARARAILDLDPDTQVQALRQEGEGLVRELSLLGQEDLCGRLVSRLNAFLADASPLRRLPAAETLAALYPAWDTPLFVRIRSGFEMLVRSALEREQDARVYPKLADLGAWLVEDHLKHERLEKALEILGVFKRHYVLKDNAVPHRSEAAYRRLERVASSPVFAEVAARLKSGDPLAARVVETLDVAATRFLIAELKTRESPSERIKIAEIISRTGASASAVLSEEVQRTTIPSEAIKLLDVLPHALTESVAVVTLNGLLRHPALAVRRRTATLLADRGYARAGDLLLDALREEKEASIRAALIESLGRVRHAPAVPALETVAEARQEPEELRAAACSALGKIGSAEALPALVGLSSKSPRGITGILRSNGPAIRTAAVRALGAFAGQAAAREALKQAAGDPDAVVRDAARDVLYAPLRGAFGEIAKEVQMISAAEEVKAGDVKLAGSLTEIPLDQICQLIGSAGKTGLLRLNFDGAAARVYFEQGEVVAAEFDGRADQEAFNRFITRRQGHFLFQPQERTPERRLRKPVQSMLLEAHRAADEGSKVLRVKPPG